MGRQNVFVVCLVLMAVLGLAAAASSPSASPSKAPSTSKTGVVEAPVNGDQIGTTDDGAAPSPGDDDVAVAGPLGSDSSYSSNGPSGSADSADSGSVALGVSIVVVGVTTIASSFLFL